MTTKTRLQKAEKAIQQRGGTTISLYILFPDYVMHNGERLTLAEFEARQKGSNDTIINVHYRDDGERITDIGGAKGGTVKRYVSVSPLDWDN